MELVLLMLQDPDVFVPVFVAEFPIEAMNVVTVALEPWTYCCGCGRTAETCCGYWCCIGGKSKVGCCRNYCRTWLMRCSSSLRQFVFSSFFSSIAISFPAKIFCEYSQHLFLFTLSLQHLCVMVSHIGGRSWISHISLSVIYILTTSNNTLKQMQRLRNPLCVNSHTRTNVLADHLKP